MQQIIRVLPKINYLRLIKLEILTFCALAILLIDVLNLESLVKMVLLCNIIHHNSIIYEKHLPEKDGLVRFFTWYKKHLCNDDYLE